MDLVIDGTRYRLNDSGEIFTDHGFLSEKIGELDSDGSVYSQVMSDRKKVGEITSEGEILKQAGLFTERVGWIDRAGTVYSELGSKKKVILEVDENGTVVMKTGPMEEVVGRLDSLDSKQKLEQVRVVVSLLLIKPIL